MKRKLVTCITLVACMFVFCLGLVGCGPDYRENYVGTWRVTSMVDSAGTDLTPTIEQLADANKYLTLTLSDEEDAATFDLAGQTTLTGTWEPAGEAECLINFEGYGQIPASLADGMLTFKESGQTMTCERVGAEGDSGSAAEGEQDAAEGQSDETPAE